MPNGLSKASSITNRSFVEFGNVSKFYKSLRAISGRRFSNADLQRLGVRKKDK
jgi:hypothetical protein